MPTLYTDLLSLLLSGGHFCVFCFAMCCCCRTQVWMRSDLLVFFSICFFFCFFQFNCIFVSVCRHHNPLSLVIWFVPTRVRSILVWKCVLRMMANARYCSFDAIEMAVLSSSTLRLSIKPGCFFRFYSFISSRFLFAFDRHTATSVIFNSNIYVTAIEKEKLKCYFSLFDIHRTERKI